MRHRLSMWLRFVAVAVVPVAVIACDGSGSSQQSVVPSDTTALAGRLQWQDIDLARGLLRVRRSYHSHAYGEPKTKSARRTVELLPETVRVLRAIQPLHVAPDMPVFTSTNGGPIEPKAFSEHWYDALRALALRVRGLYCTKDTYVSIALQTVRDPWWVEKQTGVALATVKAHYAKWMPDDDRSELRRLASVDPSLLGNDSEICPRLSVPGAKGGRRKLREQMRGGGLEPANAPESTREIVRAIGANGRERARTIPQGDSGRWTPPYGVGS